MHDGDQTRNDLAKDLDSAKNILNDKKSVFKAVVDVKADLDARVKSVNDAVSAKAQADAKAAASAPSMVDGDYGATARRGGNGYRAPSQNGGSSYRAPSRGGGTTDPKGGNGDIGVNRRLAWVGTTDGSDGEADWEGDHLIGHRDF